MDRSRFEFAFVTVFVVLLFYLLFCQAADTTCNKISKTNFKWTGATCCIFTDISSINPSFPGGTKLSCISFLGMPLPLALFLHSSGRKKATVFFSIIFTLVDTEALADSKMQVKVTQWRCCVSQVHQSPWDSHQQRQVDHLYPKYLGPEGFQILDCSRLQNICLYTMRHLADSTPSPILTSFLLQKHLIQLAQDKNVHTTFYCTAHLL